MGSESGRVPLWAAVTGAAVVVVLVSGAIAYEVASPHGGDSGASAEASPSPPPSPSGASPSAATYTRYANARFGFSVDVPTDLRAEAPPEDGDGLGFLSADGTAELRAYGALNVDHLSADQDLKDLKTAHQADQVTYASAAKGVAAVSGFHAGAHGREIFYQRDVVGASTVYTLLWTYPVAQQPQRGPEVDHTVASFKAGSLS